MKIIDLNGEQHVWSLTGHTIRPDTDRSIRSQYHLNARKLLLELYPTLTICEEVPITIRRGQTSYLDFYLPLRKMAVEVHGRQHFEYVPHFHHTLAAYAKARRRDEEKREFCDINNITLIEFPYNESVQEWKDKLV